MTFLNPMVLLGLIAAGIPVLIHLLQLKKLRQIEFSSIRFLKEIQHASARKVKLRDYLLLLVRTLAIAALVMAFARPAIKGISGINSKSATALIIDDSPSTTARNEFGEVYGQEKSAAASLLTDFHLGDDVTLLYTSHAEDTSRVYSTVNPQMLASEIARSGPTEIWGNYTSAIHAALNRLASANYVDKEIYLIGDFQQTQVEPDSTSSTRPESPLLPNTRIFFIRTTKSPDNNLSVSNVLFPNPVVEVGIPTEVDATIQNSGTSDKSDVVVSLYVDNRKVGQAVADVPAGSSKDVKLPFTVSESGFHQGVVQIDDNSVQSDNKFYFSFYVIQKLNVGIVVDDSSNDFVLSAIKAVTTSGGGSGFGGDSAIQIDVRVFSPQQFTYANLSSTDVVVVESYSAGDNFASKMMRFVKGGGGALLFAPAPAEGSLFGSVASDMDIGTVTKFFASPPGSFVGLDRIDVGARFFSGMFSSAESAAQIKSQLVTKVFAGCEMSANPFDHILMSTTTGPFLLGREIGSGFVFLLTSPADTASTSFPMSPFFPVVVQRALFFSSAVRHAPVRTVPGHDVEYRLAVGGIRNADMISPDGSKAEVVPNYVGGTAVFSLTGINRPGTYSLVAGDTISEVSANVDPRVSNLSQASRSEIVAFAKRFGFADRNVFVVDASKNTATSIENLRSGRDLSSLFATVALLLLILEIFISRMKTFPAHGTSGTEVGAKSSLNQGSATNL